MVLVISEKPSVAASLASVLGANKRKDGYFEGNSYIVSYCFGHLLELAAPDAYGEQYAKWKYEDLPIVPDVWKHVVSKDKAAQVKILKELMTRADVDCVVNACDAGREGELIFRLVYNHAKCRKPIKRLWISSMEDSAVKAGFASLKDGAEYENLYAAASCREQADWAVGISATRLFTVLYGGATLNVGRVQSPTLALLVNRESEIANFVKTPFYTAELTAEVGAGGFTAASERYDDKAAAERVVADCSTATVTSVTQTEKTTAPPKLFDLTTLQREANKAHGFTAQQTLDYVQSLYEKKYASYPRTDSRYLTDDMAASVAALVGAIAPAAPCDAAQVINGKKVNDHHAILPTISAITGDLSALPSGEHAILDMLMCRVVCAVGVKHRYLETVVTLEAGGVEFKTRGKVITHNGWKDYAAAQNDGANEDSDGDDEDESGDKSLPEIAEGQTFPAAAKLKEGFTAPPKHFTESAILGAMENAGVDDFKEIDGEVERKGLGTSATRAACLEALVKRGYVERNKKNLLPTDKGKNLIAILPTALTSAKLTAEWEQKLLNVQRGELASDEFMGGIAAFIRAIVLENNAPKPEFANLFPSDRKNAASNAPSLGRCPRCGGDVTEWAKGFSCANNKTCGFKLWKESKFFTAKKKPLTAAIVTRLLKDGKVALKDLYSEKTGKTYNATIFFDNEGVAKVGQYVDFGMQFEPKGKVRK